jgi:hypothetical protein
LGAVRSQEQVLQGFEFGGSLDEARRRVGRHEGDARGVAAFAEMSEKGGPFFFEVVEVRLAHPARHLIEPEFVVRRGFDRIDADALLARVAPLFLNVAGGDGGRGH